MDPILESHAIFVDAWDALNEENPAYQSRRGGLIDVSWGGVPLSFLNLGVVMRSPATLSEFTDALADTIAWTRHLSHPWLLAVPHETVGPLLAEIESELAARGMVALMPLTGMVADDIRAADRPLPTGNWITEAAPRAGFLLSRVNEAAYHMSFGEPGTLNIEKENWWRSPRRIASVLTVDGQPVSSTAVVDAARVRYVALVATHPEHQRKGYAEAAMRHALRRALAAGQNQRSYLHASAAGRPVYERMGYRATAEYTLYLKAT
ncbi:MAG: GNAT family N-acetyltransferase [Acidobacteria bacterium]|nr:GNAT family N-acetyltransferase [Acidobacteriota bacterium]